MTLATNPSGNTISSQDFDPWGAVRSGGVAATAFNYTGQRLDGTGLLYYHARMYDPVLGRFVSPDTLVPNPANPQDLNRYSYVGNNPINRVDPSGHDWGQFWLFAQGLGSSLLRNAIESHPVMGVYRSGQQIYAYAVDPVGVEQRAAEQRAILARGLDRAWNHPERSWEVIKNSPYEYGELMGNLLFAAATAKAAKMMEVKAGQRVDGEINLTKASVEPTSPSLPRATELKFSRTVENHALDLSKKGTYARPYMDPRVRTRIIQEIMDAADPVPDPQGVPGALRWDVEGGLGTSKGVWELVIDTNTNTVLHFLFRGVK